MAEVVTSIHNKMIKTITSLKQKKYRDEHKLFIAEGIRLVEEAVKSDWEIEVCVFTPEAVLNERTQQILQVLHHKRCQIVEVSEQVYHRLSDTEQPQGIMVVLRQKSYSSGALQQKKQLIAIMDQVQDPGNVGTIIRTADAVGCSAVIMTRGCADVYAAKTVRATMGSLFHVPVICGWDVSEIARILQDANVTMFSTTLDETSIEYFKADFNQSCAIIFGNEGNGVSTSLLEISKQRLHIPMLGKAESLNVAVSAAIILYEAIRQRVF